MKANGTLRVRLVRLRSEVELSRNMPPCCAFITLRGF